MIGIYKITSPTKRIYIGQSLNIEERFNTYKRLHCKKQIRLYRSLLSYGIDKHKFEIICECSIDELNDKERYYQDLYNVLTNGLNCMLTKTNDRSGKLSEEIKSKISKSNKGKKHSEETKLKMSTWQIGRKQSEESIKKRIETNKGYKHSEESKVKMSKSHIGKKLTDEHKIKIGLSNKNGKRSKETKSKMSKSRNKIILNTETGIFYFGSKEASESVNINTSTFKNYLNGKAKNKTYLIRV